MDNVDRQPGAGHTGDAAPDASGDIAAPPSLAQPDKTLNEPSVEEAHFDETLGEELSSLIDDGRNYAQAEIRFQKTRARLTGRLVGTAAISLGVSLILLHIAFLALAVGLVIALAPIITIWGAIVTVFGGILVLAAVLARIAWNRAKRASVLFSSRDEATRNEPAPNKSSQ